MKAERNKKTIQLFLYTCIVFSLVFTAGSLYYLMYPPHDLCNTSETIFKLHQRRTQKGYKHMKSVDVVFVGVTRDNGEELEQVIKHIENTGSLFRDYKVIMYENDSEDNTRAILEAWQRRNDKVTLILETKGWEEAWDSPGKGRFQVLAYCRNQYLTLWKTNPLFKKLQYLIVVDMDLKFGWDPDGIAHSFGYSDWDMICSNGMIHGQYYDTLALRDRRFGVYMGDQSRERRDELDNLAYPTVGPLISLDSCFGGLAIYNRSSIGNCKYEGYDCEHVTLHQCMQANNHSKIYLNPFQLVYYDTPTYVKYYV